LITDPDPAPVPALFGCGFQDAKTMFVKLFSFFLIAGTLTSFFKDNMRLRSHKTVEIMSREGYGSESGS
jgi:hypothetical protein